MDLAVAVAAVFLTGSLLVDVRVPWGGRVPLGLALLLALPSMLSTGRTSVAAVAAVVVVACVRWHGSLKDVAVLVTRLGGAAVGAVAGAALADVAVQGTPSVLVTVVGSSAGVLAAELLSTVTRTGGAPVRLRSASLVYLTLVTGGALLAIATQEVGVAMAAVAALPLLITRFSFERYAEATDTLRETVQALGLVPELAGLAPIGHSERAACYAAAMADELDFDAIGVDLVVTATRLHHLGAVREEFVAEATPRSPQEMAEAGARILRESGFPEGVAELLEQARADGHGGDAPTLAAAVVGVATVFDHVVGEDPSNADRGLAVLGTVALDRHGRRAAAALLARVAERPTLVSDAIASGDRFRAAADGLDLEALVAENRMAELLPFGRKR